MIDRAIHAEPAATRTDTAIALDERSMRVLELGLAGLSLLAVALLTVLR